MVNNKKTAAIISLIVSSVIFCVSCGVLIYALTMDSSNKTEYLFGINGAKICNVQIPQINKSVDFRQIENVDSRASIAKKLRNNTDSVLDNLKKSSSGEDIVKYKSDGEIVRIDAGAGYGGFNCNRSYYYNYGVLYMADMYTGEQHEEMYFSENVMYRYIDSEGKVKSNAFSDEEYCDIARFALYEGLNFIK